MFHVEHSTKFFKLFYVSRGTYTAQFLAIVDNFSKMWHFLPIFTKNGNFYVDNYLKFLSKFSSNPLMLINLCFFLFCAVDFVENFLFSARESDFLSNFTENLKILLYIRIINFR